ncbi:MAG TPA: hypothetical protein VGG89_11170 [Candidatus Baltobacteraceae bacterium]|jgi:hypothetical protein
MGSVFNAASIALRTDGVRSSRSAARRTSTHHGSPTIVRRSTISMRVAASHDAASSTPAASSHADAAASAFGSTERARA